jgi:hypothetical protein
MYDAIEPLGNLLSTLPIGPEHPGATAGAPFELFYQPDYLRLHHRAAWLLFAERLDNAASFAGPHPQVERGAVELRAACRPRPSGGGRGWRRRTG